YEWLVDGDATLPRQPSATQRAEATVPRWLSPVERWKRQARRLVELAPNSAKDASLRRAAVQPDPERRARTGAPGKKAPAPENVPAREEVPAPEHAPTPRREPPQYDWRALLDLRRRRR